MVFNIRTFRTRSPHRDSQSDEIRLKSVKVALEEVIAGINSEIKGLQKRVDSQLQQASHILEMSGEYSERSPQDEKNVMDLEAQVMIAKNRVKTLEKQLGIYEVMQKELTQIAR